MFRLALGVAVLAFLGHGVGHAAEQEVPVAARALLGTWKQEKTNRTNIIRFEPERFVQLLDGRLRFERVRYRPGKREAETIVVRRGDPRAEPLATVEVKDGALSVSSPQGPRAFKRLDRVPAELEPRPLPLGKPVAVAADKARAVKTDLARREKANLKVRFELRELKKPDERAAKIKEMLKIDEDDTRYLVGLIKEVGWIDSRRFGDAAAHSAYLIAMHTHDFSLMLTAVHEIEREVKAGRSDAESWAGLHDRYRDVTGQRERFGHHVFANRKGELVIGPLEDRKKVNQFRKEFGLPTLAEYLARHREANGGKDVQIVDDD